jgi:4-amino-4-deoxy-L-arabinose transferase-like glycosyltransferase
MPVSDALPATGSSPLRTMHPLVVLAVALLAFLLRAGFVASDISPGGDAENLLFPDEQQYWHIARAFVAGQGLRDTEGNVAARMPGYCLFLAAAAGIGGDHGLLVARLAQSAIAAAGCVVAMLLAARLAGASAGVLAGLLLACDPFGVYFSRLLLHEVLIGVLLLVLVFCSLRLRDSGNEPRFDWALVTGCLVVGMYVNPALVGLSVAWACLWALSSTQRARWVGVVMLLVLPIVAMLPWAVRNRLVLGEWVWLTTRAGITLYDGQGPQATGSTDLAAANAMPEVQELGELQRNRFFLERSWQQMSAGPWRVLRLAAVKFGRTWSPWLHAEQYRRWPQQVISIGWTASVYLLAGFGLWQLRRRWWTVLLLLAPAIYLSMVHMVFVGSVRYRVPILPILDVLAGVGAFGVWRQLTSGRSGERSPAG